MDFIESKSLFDITAEYKQRLIRLANTDDVITGISSGFYELDAVSKGFQPATLTIVGGVSGMGKTMFAVSLIKKMAIENRNLALFFSLKLTSERFITIILGQQTNIATEKLRIGLLDEKEKELLHEKIEQLKDAPLEFYDYPFLRVKDIDEVLSFTNPHRFPKIVVIDSLQLMAKNKKDKVAKVLNKKEHVKIVFELKVLAKKHQISIILLTQIQAINRKTWNKRPQYIDVNKYAPIANYADLILLLYRPEYYKIDEWDDEECIDTTGEAEIMIVKNTNCILENVRVKFNGAKGEFDNLHTKGQPEQYDPNNRFSFEVPLYKDDIPF